MTLLKNFCPSDFASGILADSTSNCPSLKKITYTYDSMNRRVARTDEKGTTQYLYGNANYPFQITAVRDPSGNLSVYHYDDFGFLFAIERDANWYYVNTDQLGTPQVVCDADGEVVKVLQYDNFGNQISDSNPTFELHISFAGGLTDADTELVRFGFRDYDSVSAKWTAKDPIGFAGGDINLYGYVLNNPTNLIDPEGLSPLVECLRDCALNQYGINLSRDGATILAGQPLLPKSWYRDFNNVSIDSYIDWWKRGGPFTKCPNKGGTSFASILLRKIFPQSLPTSLKLPMNIVNKFATTKIAGAVLGRIVPAVGWGLLAWDAYSIGSCTYKCQQSNP